ncbi:MAG: glycosyltransferase [Sphingobium sp.]
MQEPPAPVDISVLTIVRNREPHLHQLIEGLTRSRLQPDELIVVDMSDCPVKPPLAPFPIAVHRLEGTGLPLAKARNLAAKHAAQDNLVFLDVDCIPMTDCLTRLVQELGCHNGLLCADIRYLGPDDARGEWTEADLLARGRPHSARLFPATGVREEPNPGLFWSLAFAIRRSSFAALGGFDEAFEGYGAEDTDFGFRARDARLPLLFVGGAIACHQHHDSHEPPVQHLKDIVQNATLFHRRWNRWPMEGWLSAFQSMGLIEWTPQQVRLVRMPDSEEIAATKVA